MTENNSVELEKRGQAYWITINRPEKPTPSTAMLSPASSRDIAMHMRTPMFVLLC
jgi:hypothetical protein